MNQEILETQETQELENNQLISQEKKDYIQNQFQDYVNTIKEWVDKAKQINVTNENETDLMSQAKEGRLILKSKRVEIEKTRVKLKKQSLEEGRMIDVIAKSLIEMIKPAEEHLELQEKYAEIKEYNRIQKLKSERLELLKPYISVINPNELQLDILSDEAFNTILNGAKFSFQEAEKKRLEEEENIRKEEEKLKLFKDRKNIILPYQKFFDLSKDIVINIDTTEDDFNNYLNQLKKRSDDYDKEIIKLKKQNESLKKQNNELKVEVKSTNKEVLTIKGNSEISIKSDISNLENIEKIKENLNIAKLALQDVLSFIIPDNCRNMVYDALNRINNNK